MSVALLIPSAGQRALANLARDAIAAATAAVDHDVYLLDHSPWGPPPVAHLKAITALRRAIEPEHSHVFLMHDDALPLRAGWLATLLKQELPAAAIVSRRSGRGQSAGTLFSVEQFLGMDLSPNLPAYDVAESLPTAWRASMVRWRGPGSTCGWQPPEWIIPFECDVALDDEGEPLFVHLGGGTIGTPGAWGYSAQHVQRIERWIAAAREGLGL